MSVAQDFMSHTPPPMNLNTIVAGNQPYEQRYTSDEVDTSPTSPLNSHGPLTMAQIAPTICEEHGRIYRCVVLEQSPLSLADRLSQPRNPSTAHSGPHVWLWRQGMSLVLRMPFRRSSGQRYSPRAHL